MADRVEANSNITIHWETELLDVLGNEWLEKLKVKRKILIKKMKFQLKVFLCNWSYS